MTRTMIFLASALALAVLATPANAAEARQRMAEPVTYADLDLSSEAGAATMLKRMRYAAREICDDTPRRRSLAQNTRTRQCVDGSLDRAVARLNEPAVTALHNGTRRGSVEIASR